ncbi:hypothetical protein BKP37_03700 [Anaerobacillus alkalilacustris]|uniref:Uncharacterized protein n=1 Tax=Anaerobacillus alkalilacustris TaxID=393763 RepID=A0A1S2LYN3_9BACI|nr:hypothetical protein BKP37_03700 [Anaerobacillus alkalilacustris]
MNIIFQIKKFGLFQQSVLLSASFFVMSYYQRLGKPNFHFRTMRLQRLSGISFGFPKLGKPNFHFRTMRLQRLSGISFGFPKLSQSTGQVAHVLLTRPPLTLIKQALIEFARLACIRHAASVRPEPGSNSP